MPPAEGQRKIACQLCRRRKSACDGKQPCGHCRQKGAVCEYPARHNPTGLRTGYVAQLEQRLALVEDRLAEVERRAITPAAHQISVPAVDVGHFSNGHSPTDVDFTDLGEDHLGNMHSMVSPRTNQFQDPETALIAPQPQVSTAAQTPLRLASIDDITQALLLELCTIWVERHHQWFPILHPASLMQSLKSFASIRTSSRALVLQAIILLTLRDLPMSPAMTTQFSHELSSSLMCKILTTSTLDAAQAGLILSNHYYGDGQLETAGNLITVCCRICDRLGFQKIDRRSDLGSPTVTSPTTLRASMIDREESIRAFWMARMLDSVSSLGSAHAAQAFTAHTKTVRPCSEALWSAEEGIIDQLPVNARPAHSSAFSMCITLSTTELAAVHSFIDSSPNVDMRSLNERDRWQTNAQHIDERLTEWRDEFVAAVHRLIHAEHTQKPRPEMDPYIVLTNCVLNTTVLALLQRRAPCLSADTDAESNPSPQSTISSTDSWAFASHRCIYACENTAFKVRHMQEHELLDCSPHLVVSIFAAARFYIVHSKAVDADVPRNLHSLAFALYICGGRWLLARRCEAIIRTAVGEYRTPVRESQVPAVFYDLKRSTSEILEDLVTWAECLPANT